MGVFIDTFGTSKVNLTDGEIADIITNMDCFNLKPASIINRLKLLNPIYSETASMDTWGEIQKQKKSNLIPKMERKI